jgi:predicted RNase H-like nuclease (RuvC/YqgF family)
MNLRIFQAWPAPDKGQQSALTKRQMPSESTGLRPTEIPTSAASTDSGDPFASIGYSVLELIRKAAEREAAFAELQEGSQERIRELEAQVDRYRERERQTTLDETLLAKVKRDLIERTEEAKTSYRKFVDAAALLRVTNEENSELKVTLEDKERELSDLKQSYIQMVGGLRALLAAIEEKQMSEKLVARSALSSSNIH